MQGYRLFPSRKRDREILGEKIMDAREDIGYTTDDVAELAGISLVYYEKIESGKAEPSVFMTGRIAMVLGVRLDYLVDHILLPKRNGNS